MPEQVWPTKQPDGTIFERHVYSGPQGEGYTDIFYRETLKGKFERKQTHVGPEDRGTDLDFKPTREDADHDLKLKRLKEEKAVWVPEKGFEVKPEFTDTIDERGKDKPVDDKPVKEEKVKDAGSKIPE